jgi:hypothetical protein
MQGRMSPLALILVTFLALPLGFVAGLLRDRKARFAAFLGVLILPILVYTFMFFSYGAAGQGHTFYWWVTGLRLLGLPFGLWFFIAIGGFALGLTSRKPSA